MTYNFMESGVGRVSGDVRRPAEPQSIGRVFSEPGGTGLPSVE